MRIFYETLLEQKPNSIIAAKWCIEHGILERTRAEELLKVVERAKKKTKL
jgi:hypothetical protein